ncbi:MAG: hypothetical protein RR603_04400 [Kurthia sp.]
MNTRGQRVIFDELSGNIVATVGEMWGETTVPQHIKITKLAHIDLPYGHVPEGGYVESIDPVTRKPVIRFTNSSENQKRINRLEEDVLLLQTENESGGIL